MSGNFIIIAVFYAGGLMMTESLLTIGELSAFLLYAAYVGVSIGGKQLSVSLSVCLVSKQRKYMYFKDVFL